MKKNVHIIPHSHWDREWYMPFEYHRAYLVKLIDDCMELFEKDKEFKSFHLDGHTALVEDYLEIKPQNEEKIKEYISTGRFAVGPWYVLQDEFLTSSEANVRNLLVGMDLAKKLGKVTKFGYFPDAFGNAGQMPQLLSQAGMDGIIFGRGVKPVGVDNSVAEGGNYASKYSEIYWASPDGSALPSAVFMNWYCNAMEIPADADRKYWDYAIKSAEKYAATNELLLMNGSDHQPVQKDLSEALKNAREKYPEYNFIHSDFETYMKACTKNLPYDVETITGELTSQDTDGWTTLVNTCSAHIDLKVMNRKCEILLEGVAEPLSVMTSTLGKKYPHEQLLYSWKTLMKNHPHDSICGCSCDEVNEEVKMRFKKAQQSAEIIIKDNLEYLKERIDTSAFADFDGVFAVVNTMPHKKTSVVSTDIDLRRVYHSKNVHETFKKYNASIYMGEYELIDESGNTVPCTIDNRKSAFGYEIPDDKFRQPYVAERITVSFEAEDIPAAGYKVYGIRKTAKTAKTEKTLEANVLENEYIKAEINPDGTIDMTDRKTGRSYEGLLRFEDTGDIGTEYTYVPAKGDTILSGEKPARIELIRCTEFVTEYKVSVEMEIPAQMDDAAKYEKSIYTELQNRCGGRSKETVTLPVTSYITLGANSKRLDIKTIIENNARDHRVRVLFPTGIDAKTHKAETIFEAVERPNSHKPTWTYPSGCEHQQGYVMMKDETGGFAVANIGLYEYETIGNTIAVTLLRAVSEMGDWGVFPTELSQMQKALTLEYSIMPYVDEAEAVSELSAFQYPVLTTQLTEYKADALDRDILSWSGDFLKATALKKKMNGEDIILRWANYSDKEQILTINKTSLIDNLYRSNVIEEKGEILKAENGVWKIVVKPYEIITLGVEK